MYDEVQFHQVSIYLIIILLIYIEISSLISVRLTYQSRRQPCNDVDSHLCKGGPVRYGAF